MRVHLARYPSHTLATLVLLCALSLPASAHAQSTLSSFGIARGSEGNV